MWLVAFQPADIGTRKPDWQYPSNYAYEHMQTHNTLSLNHPFPYTEVSVVATLTFRFPGKKEIYLAKN